MHHISIRLYRLLLQLYPAGFRREYGDLIEQAFRDRLRDARHQGIVAVGMCWLHALSDLIVNALGERLTVVQTQSFKHRTLRGAGFVALVLSYPLLWYGICIILAFYAEPTGIGSPAGTVQYYVARLARISVLAYGLPTVIAGISLLIVARAVVYSQRTALLWLLALTNTLVTPVTILLFFPVRELVHGLGLVTYKPLYYPPMAFFIWIPVMVAQIVFLLWLHHRIVRWALLSRKKIILI